MDLKILRKQGDYDGEWLNSKGKRKKGSLIFYHIGAWALFITYEISSVFVITHHTSSFGDYIFHYLLNIILFYFNVHVVLPLVFKTSNYKYIILIPALLLESTLYVGVNFLLNYYLEISGVPITWRVDNLEIFFSASLWRAFYIIGISFGYWFVNRFFRSMKRIAALTYRQNESQKKQLLLEKQVIQSENAFLQAQINPHLLFNTLNFIYNSVEEVSSKAGDAIILLSDITRYSLQRMDNNGLVPLHNEITNIHNIIKLNQLRFNSKLNLNVSISTGNDDEKITPLILISFIENVFKHGDLRCVTHPAEIAITVSDHRLFLLIQNKKLNRHEKGHGIGINNSKTRLENKYPNRHLLNIKENDDEYQLKLELSL